MNPSAVTDALYREDLPAFAERAMAILEPQTALKTSWHHRAIAHQLGRCRRGEIRRLIINQPPKTLKTHLVSVAFVAHLLMHDPAAKIAILSYDEALASRQLRAVRQLLGSDWYRHLAPDTHVGAGKDTEFLFETTAGGEVRALSMQGGITGYGFDYIIIDDPMKASAANSETERDKLKEFYSSSIANRWRNPAQGVLILVMQRLHVDDFTMLLLRIAPDAVHLNIPAVAPYDMEFEVGPGKRHLFRQGDLLEPERLSVTYLAEMHALQGKAHYEAQYLQNPLASGGQIIDPDWFRHFASPGKPDYTVLSIDPAFTEDGGDNSAALVCNLIGEDVEIIHGAQAQLNYPNLVRWILQLDKHWAPVLIVVEAIGAGMALRHWLGRSGIPHATCVTSHHGKSKVQRMEIVSPLIEAGHVWLPEEGDWVEPFRRSIAAFPDGRSDDWPDALSQVLLHLDQVRHLARRYHNRRFPPEPPPLPPTRRHSMHYHREEWTW